MLTMEIFASTERRKLPCVSERIGEGACSILSILAKISSLRFPQIRKKANPQTHNLYFDTLNKLSKFKIQTNLNWM